MGRCDDTYAYIADVRTPSMLVYSTRLKRSWQVVNKLFFPCSTYGTITIAGDQFDLMDGIFGMAVKKPTSPRDGMNKKISRRDHVAYINRNLFSIRRWPIVLPYNGW